MILDSTPHPNSKLKRKAKALALLARQAEACRYVDSSRGAENLFPAHAPADTVTRDGSPKRCCSSSFLCDYFFCCAGGACSLDGGTMFLSRM